MKTKTSISLIIGLAASLSVEAAVYSNAPSATIGSFGYPNTTSYGQTFSISSSSTLNSWDFYA